MCGIAGIIDRKSGSLETDIIKMRDAMPYRGPDGIGAICFPPDGVALGHRRLTILDLTDAGSQPMENESGTIVIVHNGEVYNFIELRKELEGFGYRFRSGTDTEVILSAYDKWGVDCLKRFNGMFAFAIWDRKKKEIFIARDRLGIKPLYYFHDNDKLLFASELKSVLKVLDPCAEIDYNLVDLYMSFGYVPGEHTLLKGIKRLLPGHFICWDGKKLINEKYWDVSFEKSHDRSLQYYVKELRKLLNDSIGLRLRSDVPLGIFLSGGIDSSAVVAMLAPRVNRRLKTFSVAYDFGADFNETDYAKIVADKFNTEHHEFIVSPAQFRDFIPQYVHHMDEPVTESAAISLYYIAKMASKHVTVVLSGEGSDELFAGYDFYYYNYVIEKLRKVLDGKGSSSVFRFLCSNFPAGKIKKYLLMGLKPLERRYKGISTYDEQVKEELYRPEFKEYLVRKNDKAAEKFLDDLFTCNSGKDALSRMLYFDTKTWLVDDLLIKADRMSMAASLELRVPFLDHRIVEFAAKIPDRYKLNGRITKYILKEMLSNILPREIVHRKKMGFPTPLKVMFQDELAGYAQDLLAPSSSRISSFFDIVKIRRLINDHVGKIKDNHRIIWQLLVLETWLQLFDT